MKLGMEVLRGIRYKLRIMGVPIAGPTYVYGDNMSVIHNAVRKTVAMGKILTSHVWT
jgi:hypothetical protein